MNIAKKLQVEQRRRFPIRKMSFRVFGVKESSKRQCSPTPCTKLEQPRNDSTRFTRCIKEDKVNWHNMPAVCSIETLIAILN